MADSKELFVVSAKDVAQRFGYYSDEAILHPLAIQRRGVTRLVMLSLDEYDRLKMLAGEGDR